MTATARRPQTREEWLSESARSHVGTCQACGRDRDDDGKRLTVARVEGGRIFRCFDCSTHPRRRSRVTATAKKPAAAARIPDPPAAPPELVLMPIGKLVPAKDNPRREVGDVAELAQSIRSMGLLEPIVATQRGTGHYLIVAGARRHAAAKLAGLTVVPTIVRSMTDAERVEAMLVENLQRQDLAPLEEAGAYRRLVDEFKLSQRELADKIGVSQGQISKRLQLLDLPKPIQAELDSGGITIADAHQLLQLKNMPARLDKAFKNAKRWGDIAGTVSTQLREHELEQTIAKTTTELTSQGVRVVARGDNYYGPAGCIRLDSYQAQHELRIKPAAHAKLDCHAAYIDTQGEPIYVCTKPKSHKPGDAATIKPDDQKARERGEREAEKRKQLKARQANIEFGALLARKLAAPAIDPTNMRLLADLLINELGSELGWCSFRYVDEASQTVHKNRDETIRRIEHVEGNAAKQLLTDRLEVASTPEQIMGVLLQALLAARYADTGAVPQSQRQGYVKGVHGHFYGEVYPEQKRIQEALVAIGKKAGVVTTTARTKSRA